jgi:hypothetical protein
MKLKRKGMTKFDVTVRKISITFLAIFIFSIVFLNVSVISSSIGLRTMGNGIQMLQIFGK